MLENGQKWVKDGKKNAYQENISENNKKLATFDLVVF